MSAPATPPTDPEVIVKEAVRGLNAGLSQMTGPDGLFPLAEEEVSHWGTKQRYLCFQDGPNSVAYRTLPHMYGDIFARNCDQTMLVYEAERWTYSDVQCHAAAVARALAKEYGIKRGQTVAIAGRNTPDWVISLVAVSGFLSGIALPVNSWWVGDELRYGLEDSGTSLLFADAFILSRSPFLAEMKVPAILMRGDVAAGSMPPGTRTFKDLVAIGQTILPMKMQSVDKDDTGMLMYTSGTTSKPKGVVLTHRSITTAMNGYRALLYSSEFPGQPVMLAGSPLFHVNGSHVALFAAMCLGAKLCMLPKWETVKVLEMIQVERVNRIVGVPTMTYEIANHPDFDKYDTSSLIAVGGGGANFAAAMIKRVNDKIKSAKVGTGYGLTETNGISAVMPGPLFPMRPASCGLPLFHLKVCILDEHNKKMPIEAHGEICLSGAAIMKEYWNKPDQTEEVFFIDEQGTLFFRTGDLGKVDEQGFLYILDRAKDIIIRGGENISCGEVETAVFEHPAVAEVAAIGMPDTNLGEVVVVAVVAKSGVAKPSDEELRQVAAKKLAGFKVPSEVYWWPEAELPRGATGKIQKRDIREVLKAKRAPPSKL